MSLFQAIVDSISNPQHAGSNSDLQGLLNLAQLIPGVQDTEQHVKPILDVLGPHLQDVLNNQQQTQGQAAAQHLWGVREGPTSGDESLLIFNHVCSSIRFIRALESPGRASNCTRPSG